MATRFQAGLTVDSSVLANFRAFAQFIEDTLVTTGGWVVTADTGQTLPSALAVPTAGSTKMGYRIYRMADALQATAPVFMRIDFGGGGANVLPAVWLTIGTGTNGSGTITGQLFACNYTGPQQGGSGNCYGSAATNRFTIAMFVNAGGGAQPFTFGLERSKDSSGNDTVDGLLFVVGSTGYFDANNTYLSTSAYIICAGGVQPAWEKGLSYILTTQNPTQVFAPGDVGLGIVIHIKGVAVQPGANYFITCTGDVSAEGVINLTLYGASHTYQHLNLMANAVKKALRGSASGLTDTNARILMRYD